MSISKIELLSPAGDFDCLKAAIQNGANTVYLGSTFFSARKSATNFDLDELKNAIEYAHLRNVKVNLTLNTLIKNDELSGAFELAKKAYEFGVDALIVQDLGLSSLLIKELPDLDLHASTQMTAHSLDDVKYLSSLGFKRVVLSRELNIDEIKYICNNTDVEIEVFIHGALCISYSGQCLLSSMIGGRSGNRGSCAQACRLPYELLENDLSIDKGYLLSTRDLCSINVLKDLIDCNITCFKIEGRMKTPQYVATVTSIYRKYIDLIRESQKQINLSSEDENNLLQVFNRGGFSLGHLANVPNKNLIFKEKPNNIGIYIGKVYDFNQNNGYVKLELENKLELGDTISINDCSYTVSELMINKQNVKIAFPNTKVTIGRMKGKNIKRNAKIYKLESKSLKEKATRSYENSENVKIKLVATISIKKNAPIKIHVKTNVDESNLYYGIEDSIVSNIIPVQAINNPITKERIIAQFSKTGNTEFEFTNIDIDLDENLYIQNISSLNELRRTVLQNIENKLLEKCSRKSISNPNLNLNTNLNIDLNLNNTTISNTTNLDTSNSLEAQDQIYENKSVSENNSKELKTKKINILLNILHDDYNYLDLEKENIDKIYIPLKYFINSDSELNNISSKLLSTLCNNFNCYIYFPLITKSKFLEYIKNNLNTILNNYNIKGLVISSLGQLKIINELEDIKGNYELIANYSFNVFNNYTIDKLKSLSFDTFTISPELDKQSIFNILNNCNNNSYNVETKNTRNVKKINSELICYGKIPVMNTNYCLLSNSNKCFEGCQKKCLSTTNKYYLKDRLGYKFRIIPDNIQTVSTIYNSKILSISPYDFDINNIRIDLLDENISEINNIIETLKSGNRLEGLDYTNGNLNRNI